MMSSLATDLATRLEYLRAAGLYKTERPLSSPQGATVSVGDSATLINLCSNNYLGLSADPAVVEAAQSALAEHGFGMSSVRFICGTHDCHQELEARLSAFLGFENTILYPSCFDANGGLFETLLGPDDVVISDALNHASIIDGVRLCKAQRMRYDNNNLGQLAVCLERAATARYRLIATDGVFSMDGSVADLAGIADLADRYDAMVMVDDSHGVGVLGASGRGSLEECGVTDRIDIVTGTLGKALGGASGGYISAKRDVVDWLRQRSRPYLFSNALAPMIAQASLRVLDLIEDDPARRHQLLDNTVYFRDRLGALGFDVLEGRHPIVPLMLRDPVLTQRFASRLNDLGVFVTAFSFPVVPEGTDRIRAQLSAAHTQAELDRAVSAFAEVGRELHVIA